MAPSCPKDPPQVAFLTGKAWRFRSFQGIFGRVPAARPDLGKSVPPTCAPLRSEQQGELCGRARACASRQGKLCAAGRSQKTVANPTESLWDRMKCEIPAQPEPGRQLREQEQTRGFPDFVLLRRHLIF